MAEPGAFDRVSFEHGKMGRARLHSRMRVTVGTILGVVAEGGDGRGILAAYPAPEPEDMRQALAYAARLTREDVLPA
jgi:uncharacterized protein (DUF433 family)